MAETNWMRQRASLYSALSRLYRRELAGTELAALRGLRFPEGGEGPWAEARRRWNAAMAASPETEEDLAVDFARAFLGAGLAETAAAFPYESVYTSPKGVIMQEAWARMHELLVRDGLSLEGGAELLEDHISVELEYFAWLCGKDEPDLRAQLGYLNQHLLNWVPRFCADLDRYAETGFYKAAAALTAAFLEADYAALHAEAEEQAAEAVRRQTEAQPEAASEVRRGDRAYNLDEGEFDAWLEFLRERYDVYAPTVTRGRGTPEELTAVRFRPIRRLRDIVNDRQSDYSAKEVYYPISQTVFRFDENDYTTVLPERTKDALILAHPCDINAIRRLDNIFLNNGGHRDLYYETLRKRVKFAMLECPSGGYEGCWCVSMGTNKTEDYALALRLESDGSVLVRVRDSEFLDGFKRACPWEYYPLFVQQNKRKAQLPRVEKVDKLQKVFDLPFWKDYNDQCISCGGCNAVCPTCSCYETADFLDQENARAGERKRVWASCMIPEFTRTAGGHVARPKPENLMRFKALHKVFDYNARFGGREHMCVGCGRCVMRCPATIDFLDTVNKLHDGVEQLIREQEAQT